MADEYASLVNFALHPRRRAFCPPYATSLRSALRHHAQYSRDSHDIARHHRELELLIDPPQSAKYSLANPSDCLAPAEVLFDAFANHLADDIAAMARGASIDRTTAAPLDVLCHVRSHVARSAVGDEIGGVVGLVRPQRLRVRAPRGVKHRQCGHTLARPIGVGDQHAHRQPRAVFHQHMSLIAQDRRRGVALAVETRIGIGGARMGVVATRLALPVRLRIAPAAVGVLIVRAVLGTEALLARPGLDQRAVDREVFRGEQITLVGQRHHFGEERFDHFVLEQPVAVLGEHRVVPDLIVDRQSDEPAKQQVVLQLLDQLALGADGIEDLQQCGADQFLRWDRGAAAVGVDRVEQPAQPNQGFIDQAADRAQRVALRHEVVQLGYREKTFLHRVGSSHRARSHPIVKHCIHNDWRESAFTRGRISTAC